MSVAAEVARTEVPRSNLVNALIEGVTMFVVALMVFSSFIEQESSTASTATRRSPCG